MIIDIDHSIRFRNCLGAIITLESLKIFCDVVQERNFSRGAAVNEVSQSAASQAVLQIEKRLGVRLIDRSKRPLTLTAEGRLYYDGCRELIERYFELEARTQSLHKGSASRILVASIYSVGLYDMNQYVSRYEAIHPGGTVRIAYLHPNKVYERVLDDDADLGLVSFPRSVRGLQVIEWRAEPMVLVCSPSHRFAGQERVAIGSLDGERFVGFDANLAVRRNIDRQLRRHRVEINMEMTFDNIEAIKRGVEIGAGVSILPEPTVRNEIASSTLVAVEMEEWDLSRPLSIIHRRRKVLSPAMKSFIELLQQGENGRGDCIDGETVRKIEPGSKAKRDHVDALDSIAAG